MTTIRTAALALFLLVLASSAQAQGLQSINLGIFPLATTDANGATPVQPPVLYPPAAITCGLAKAGRLPGVVVNPTTALFDDPADITKDCRFTITTQVNALPINTTTYKASIQAVVGGAPSNWSTLSNPLGRGPATPTGFGVQ